MIFPKVLNNTKASYNFTQNEIDNVAPGAIIIFYFVVRSDVSTPLEITVESDAKTDDIKAMTYFTAAQWTKICIPVLNAGMKSVTLATSGIIYVKETGFEHHGNMTQAEIGLKSGMWMLDDFEYYDVSKSYIGVGPTADLVCGGDYIYTIGDGKFNVINTKTQKIIATISGFGVLRQIAITDDKKFAVVTGRQDGIYIISVENPDFPKIVSTYNSIEMATGIFVSGKYAFICNRQYGVEVVDISNPENPSHLFNIHSGEVQSCTVYKNILYAGVWGERGVFMYNLSCANGASEIECIGKVATDGKGDGVSVLELDGRIYLFAATGHHARGASGSSVLDNLSYGQGNGLDIFDVTDPKNPKWVSTSKIDGRYYYTANDYWETEIGYDEASGKYFAYLTNTYNGVYVFDVTNVYSPIRIAHIDIPLSLSERTPALAHKSRLIITPWNQYESRRSPVGAILVKGHKMYIAGADSDVHVFENNSFLFEHGNTPSSDLDFGSLSEHFYKFNNILTEGVKTKLKDKSYAYIKTRGQALAVATSKSYVYIAAGSEGVIVLNKENNERLYTLPPIRISNRVGFAQGIKVYGSKLYVASGVAGLAVYDISENLAKEPKLIWTYSRLGKIAREVVVSPDGRFSVVASGSKDAWLIDNNTQQLVKSFSTSGTMYHHNIGEVIDDRYIPFWGHTGDEHWLDFGPSGARFDEPTEAVFSGGMGMTGGVGKLIIDGKVYALKITSGKGVYTNDFTNNQGAIIEGVTGMGKPTVCGKYLFVSERISRTIKIYDISFLAETGSAKQKAFFVGALTFNGNPDVIHSDGKMAYVPLGYQGILVVDTEIGF